MELIDTIDSWISSVDNYTIGQLRVQPSPGSWSMGQLYTHLLLDTRFYIEQVNTCIISDANTQEPLTEKGKFILLHGFPDLRIQGHPDNHLIPQPESLLLLVNEMRSLKADVETASKKIEQFSPVGKTCHPDPAIGYFNADQWLRFANKHFEHHLRQKKRIDLFLSGE